MALKDSERVGLMLWYIWSEMTAVALKAACDATDRNLVTRYLKDCGRSPSLFVAPDILPK